MALIANSLPLPFGSTMTRTLLDNKKIQLAVGWALIGLHYLMFSQFFPNDQGLLGHDYSYDFPLLLDGQYWFLANGLFSVPWFTPSFCGGMPLLANPATFYFSAIQFFSFIVGPMNSIRLTLLLFGALGFWGFYHLLRRVFQTQTWPALLGGALFLFNGFYTYRLIVGHIEFHAFMLVPLLAFFLMRQRGKGVDDGKRWRQTSGNCMVGGVLIAYMFYAGMAQLLLPSLLAVIALALIKGIVSSEFHLGRFFVQFFLAGALGLGLSAAKLSAALLYLENVPRHTYLLPGVDGVGKLLLLIGRVLSLGGAGIDSEGFLANFQWLLDRHEFEFGVSLVPFLLLAIGMFDRLRGRAVVAQGVFLPRLVACLAALLLILALPVAFNFYDPAWNDLLRTTPFIKNLSNFFRWFTIYIPVLILMAAVCLDRSNFFKGWVPVAAIVGMALLLVQNMVVNKDFYHAQPYDPNPVMQAYAKVQEVGRPSVISDIVVSFDQYGQPLMLQDRNDALINGFSQLLCYEPMFGYDLESLPFKTLQPGPALSESAGVLNLKNPACYLFPVENGCEVGDHFRADQRQQAQQFLSYRPFLYQKPLRQQVANAVSLLAFAGVLLFAAGSVVSLLPLLKLRS